MAKKCLIPKTVNVKLTIKSDSIINFFENDDEDLICSTSGSEILRTGNYVFTVYNHSKKNVHVTGVKNFFAIQACIIKLIEKTNLREVTPDQICVNNSTAVFSVGKNLNLRKLASCLATFYSARQTWSRLEKFPAIYFKNGCGTALIFASGKITLVGCRSLSDQVKIRLQVTDFLIGNNFL